MNGIGEGVECGAFGRGKMVNGVFGLCGQDTAEALYVGKLQACFSKCGGTQTDCTVFPVRASRHLEDIPPHFTNRASILPAQAHGSV